VNKKISGCGSHAHLTDLLDHEFQALSGFINLGTLSHIKVKHEALSQFKIEASVLVNESTNRSVQFHCLEDELTNRSVQSCDLGDELTNILVRSHELEDNLQIDQFSLTSMSSHEQLFKT
jgi:hypothetical protein